MKTAPVWFQLQQHAVLLHTQRTECHHGILDGSGNQMVNYSYDSWGKLLNISGSLASTVGAVNPSAIGATITIPRPGFSM